MKPSILLALALAAPVSFAQAPPERGAEFAVPHRLVDVGGRRLNLFCSGSGSPTVVFESPSDGAGWDWWAVQPKVATRTHACVHDRAGYGFSDPSPRAADAENAVDDLHALLKAAGVAPPYVLVGNSFGGGAMELYTWRYPEDVSGLVLAEPMHEDDNGRPDALTHGAITASEGEIIEFGNACEAQSVRGFDPKSKSYDECVGGADPSLPRSVGQVGLRQRLTPAWWHTRQTERLAFPADRAQLRAARKPFGDRPVIVLARGVSPYLIPGKPQSDTNKAIEAANLALLTDVANASTHGEIRVVAGAGHVIQETHPDAVATAVDDVLARLALSRR